MKVKHFLFLAFDTSARGPAAVLEIRDPLREPNVATKIRQELQHPLSTRAGALASLPEPLLLFL